MCIRDSGTAERKAVSGISSLGILINGKSHIFSDLFIFELIGMFFFYCSCFTRWCVSFLLQQTMTHRHSVQAVPRTLRWAQCDILKVKVSDGKVDVRSLLLHPHPVADKPDTYTRTVSTEWKACVRACASVCVCVCVHVHACVCDEHVTSTQLNTSVVIMSL